MTQFVISLIVMFAMVAAAGHWASVKQRRLRSGAAQEPGHQHQGKERHARDHR